MENTTICICGNLNDLASGNLEEISFSFNLWKIDDVFYMSLTNEIQFEVVACWVCGGLELGIKTSGKVINRHDCNCDLRTKWTNDDTIPIIFLPMFNEIQLIAYDEPDGRFPLIMDFCPVCRGVLPTTTKDFGHQSKDD